MILKFERYRGGVLGRIKFCCEMATSFPFHQPVSLVVCVLVQMISAREDRFVSLAVRTEH